MMLAIMIYFNFTPIYSQLFIVQGNFFDLTEPNLSLIFPLNALTQRIQSSLACPIENRQKHDELNC